MAINSIEVLLEVREAHLVVVFKLAEIVGSFLNGIVCQMYKFVIEIVYVELATTRSHIAIFIEVRLEAIVDARDEAVHTKVELPSINEQRTIYILLNNEGLGLLLMLIIFVIACRVVLSIDDRLLREPTLTQRLRIANYLLNLLQLAAYLYAATTIRILARLDYPIIKWWLLYEVSRFM